MDALGKEQTANSLASRGCCSPLLPLTALTIVQNVLSCRVLSRNSRIPGSSITRGVLSPAGAASEGIEHGIITKRNLRELLCTISVIRLRDGRSSTRPFRD